MSTTPKERIKIGQIGIGHNHASEKMNTLRKLTDIYEVVGIVEPDAEWRERRGHLACYEGLTWMTEEQLFNTPGLQAVAVETDGSELLPTAVRCIDAGFHIHMDKPGGEQFAPFQAMIDEAGRKKLAVQLGYMYRNNPAVQFCFHALREGWLGQVFEIHAVMSRYDGDDYRKWMSGFQAGSMYIFGSHLIDLLVAMMGKPDRITPYSRRTRPEIDSCVDNGFAVFEYPKTVATVRAAIVEVEGYKRRQLTVCGDKGTIDIRPLEPPQLRLTLSEPRGGFTAGTHDVELPPMTGRYDDQLKELAQVIRGEIENPFSLEHELLVQQCLLKACGIDPDK